MPSFTDIYALFEKYGESKLLIVLVTALATAILTKLLPYLWSQASKFISWIGGLLGGRLAFRGFRQRYLDWVITELKELKLTGIVAQDTQKKPQLEQVFVSLRVGTQREDVDEWRTRLRELLSGRPSYEPLYLKELARQYERIARFSSRERKLKVDLRAAEQRLSELDTRVANFRHLRSNAIKHGKLDVGEETSYKSVPQLETLDATQQLTQILSENERIAILGTPGAGKTTILQYIALAYAREKAGDKQLRIRGIVRKRLGLKRWRLPLFIPLVSVAGKLAKSVDGDRLPSLIETFPKILPPDLNTNRVPEAYFAHQLERGNCVVLLDGLDEVPTEDEFRAVVKAIESLALRYKGNQFIITSRIAGWRSGVNADFKLFYVNDLTDEQISTFIDSWYSAVERNAVIGRLKDESATDRIARERRATHRATELKIALRENTGVRRLATNPMLLSIIALVHRSLATLPKERSKLYDECTKTLLEQWDISRGVRVDDTNLKLQQKQAIMRRLAVAFHTGEIGDKGGGREASRDEVEKVIKEFLPSVGRTEEEATHLLQRLLERSGIITERRRNVLAFAHHTFQEYFTAQYLAIGEHKKHQQFLLEPERLMSDWWREVILLYAGLLSDSSDFIGLIAEPELDDLCMQRLRTAILCLAESIKVSNSEVRQRIASEALKVRMRGEIAREQPLSPEEMSYLTLWAKTQNWYGNAAFITAQQVADPAQQQHTMQRLETALNDPQSFIRRAGVDAMPSFPASLVPSTVIEKLRTMINDPAEDTRLAVIRALVKIDKSEQTVHVLLEALNDKSESVRRESLKALKHCGDIVSNTDAALPTIVSLMVADDPRAKLHGMRAFPLIAQKAGTEIVGIFFDNYTSSDRLYADPRILETILEQDPTDFIVNELLERLRQLTDSEFLLLRPLQVLKPETAKRLDVVGKLMEILKKNDAHKDSWLSSISTTLAILSEKGLDQEVAEAVSELLYSEDLYLRRLGLYLISDFPSSMIREAWVTNLIDALDNHDEFLVLRVLNAFLRLHQGGIITNQDQVIEKALKLMDSSSKRVRRLSQKTYDILSGNLRPLTIKASLRDVTSFDYVRQWEALELMQRFPNVFARTEVIRKLITRIPERSFVPSILARLLGVNSLPPKVKSIDLKILKTLESLVNKDNSKSIFEALLTVLGKLENNDEGYPYAESVGNALNRLARHLSPEYLSEKVVSLLRSDRTNVRLAGLQLVNSLESTSSLAGITHVITELLDDKDSEIRLEAISAMNKLRETTNPLLFRQAVSRRLEDESDTVRDRAWMLFSQNGKAPTESKTARI